MRPTQERTRNVVVVDNRHVARRVGTRIREARTRAGLTQAQVAQGRYTGAYIGALERGSGRPIYLPREISLQPDRDRL